MIDKLLYYSVIQAEVSTLYGMIREHDTGHIYTAINVLTHRLEEIKQGMSPEEQTYITLKDSV